MLMRCTTLLILFSGCCTAAFAQSDNSEQLEALRHRILEQLREVEQLQKGGGEPADDFPSVLDGDERYRYDSQPQTTKAAARQERFPRCIMVVTEQCGPCKRMRAENPDLIGDDPTYPVQYLDSTRLSVADYDIPPSAVVSCPSFFILEAPGVCHKLPDASRCRHTGPKSPEALRAYLTHATHNVDLRPFGELQGVSTEGSDATCTIRDPRDLLSALSGHLARCGGANEQIVGGLFDIDVDVPDNVPEAIEAFIKSGTFRHGDLTAYVPRETNLSSKIVTDGMIVMFSKPLTVTYDKGPITVEAELHSVSISDKARRYKLELRKKQGNWIEVPDLTVVLR